ncbi:tigger transposable element-derived protein 1-like [Portunus trituberculatus]|uniref:tigger transposable element-derived protein 1-like n=1 Tax=Portunus trituberculatus TaxID=210409 RepID=UPI001E1D0950|nr:tigger transposable element-derived protein 1-like [Portunus trituberculatus]
MAPKRPTPSTPSAAKKRKVLSLAQKMEMIESVEGGLGWTEAAKKFGLHEASVRTIYKTRDKIRWIIEQVDQKKINMDGVAIREKARNLYEHLAQQEPTSSTSAPATFIASRESGSADTDAAQPYVPVFKFLVVEGNYSPEQVFSADETGLFYKKVGNQTYIHKEVKKLPGFKAFKDRLTLMFVGNAAGDCKIKPLLVCRSANPRALKGLNKRFLPVIWKSNKKAWMTAKIFEEWFYHDFIPQVQLYLAGKKPGFQGCAAGGQCWWTHLTVTEPGPPKCLCVLPSPQDNITASTDGHGVIKTFKFNYQRAVYREALKKMDTDSSMTFMDFWKQYNIRNALTLIKQAWNEVQSSTINACWNALWPECVHDFRGFPTVHSQMQDIISLAHTVGEEGFDDMTEEDVDDVIDSHDAEPSSKELLQLEEEEARGGADDEDLDDDEETKPVFTIKTLHNLLKVMEDATSLFIETDPILERSIKFKRGVEELLLPYKETLRKNGSISQFRYYRDATVANTVTQSKVTAGQGTGTSEREHAIVG